MRLKLFVHALTNVLHFWLTNITGQDIEQVIYLEEV